MACARVPVKVRRVAATWVGMAPPRPPVLAAAAVAAAIGAAVAQYVFPTVVAALERDPDALRAGQWWRAVSPLVVQTLGWHQVAANLPALALFGLIAEWLVGRWRWLVLFAAGTLAGQVAAYAWQEPGGGSSIAICGLAGGVTVALLTGRGPVPRPFAHVTVYYVAALTGWGASGIAAAGLVCLAAAAALFGLRWLGMREAERVGLAGVVACAVVLAVTADLHGISLMSGMAAMALLRGGPPQDIRANLDRVLRVTNRSSRRSRSGTLPQPVPTAGAAAGPSRTNGATAGRGIDPGRGCRVGGRRPAAPA